MLCFFVLESTLQSHNHRLWQADASGSLHDAVRNNIAAHDATKDIDEDCLHVVVVVQDFKSLRSEVKSVNEIFPVKLKEYHKYHNARASEIILYGAITQHLSNPDSTHKKPSRSHANRHFWIPRAVLVQRSESSADTNLLHLLCSSSTADIQEIGGAASVKFDYVHGRHGQTGTIHWQTELTCKCTSIQICTCDVYRICTCDTHVYVKHEPMHPMLPSRPM